MRRSRSSITEPLTQGVVRHPLKNMANEPEENDEPESGDVESLQPHEVAGFIPQDRMKEFAEGLKAIRIDEEE